MVIVSQFHINAVHVTCDYSAKTDSISRKQWQRFKLLAPAADQQPFAVPTEFLNFLPAKWIVYSVHEWQLIR